MKRSFFKFLMLFAAISLGMASCSDEPNEGGASSIAIALKQTGPDRVSFTITVKDFTPTMYAYKIVSRGTTMTAQQIFDGGTKSGDADVLATGLVKNTDYTVWAVAASQSGLSAAASADFKTADNANYPPTSKSIGITLNTVTENGLNMGFLPGTEIKSGMVAVFAKAAYADLLREIKKNSPDATESTIIADLLFTQGLGLPIEGDEAGLDWTATILFPNTRYTILTLGMLEKETPGDGAAFEFTTSSTGLTGNPTVKITLNTISFMGFDQDYTINKDAYGYVRFITDTWQIDEFMKHYTEEDLCDYIREKDAIFEATGQSRKDMVAGANGTASKTEVRNFGFEAAGAKITVVAAALDERGQHNKTIARADYVLSPKPASKEAEFKVSGSGSATTVSPHFEFSENCYRTFYSILPASSYQADITKAGGEAKYAEFLYNEGFAMVRKSPGTPVAPILQNDWIWMGYSANANYVIVATAQNYDMLLNQKLTVSEPFKTKPLSIGTSTCNIKIEMAKISKKKADFKVLNADGKLAVVHMVCIPDNITRPTDATIYNSLISGFISDAGGSGNFGDHWAWVKGLDESGDWDPSDQSTKGGFTELTAATSYTIYYCGEDKEGGVTPLSKCQFTTAASTVGPDPKVMSLSAYTITPTSCFVDVMINDQVDTGLLIFVQESLLNYDPASGTPQDLEDAVYDYVKGQGMPFDESVTGQFMDAGMGGKNGTFYLAAVVNGSGTSEHFKFMKVKLGDGQGNVTNPAPSFFNGKVRTIPVHSLFSGKSNKAAVEANHKLPRTRMASGNVINYRTAEELDQILKGIGVSRRSTSLGEATIMNYKHLLNSKK